MSFGFLILPTVRVRTELPRAGHATRLATLAMTSVSVASSADNITKFLTGEAIQKSEHTVLDKCSNTRTDYLRCKRKLHIDYDFTQPQPTAVARRNARERKRVRMVNLGFTTLRDHVPSGAKNKKLSKVETLRSAIEYIKQLQDLLGESGTVLECGLRTDDKYEETDGYSAATSSSSSVPAAEEASSPSPSLGSDASSPYHMFSPGEETYLDLGSWFP